MSNAMKKNYLILGSGIIGLTLAYKIAKLPNTSVFIIEKEKSSGLHASGRNSGVIHSGIYYKPKTLKSIISSSSRYLFKQFLIENNINFNPNGKLIIPSSDHDQEYLELLSLRAKELDLNSSMVLKNDIYNIEPFANSSRDALFISDTLVCKPLDVIKKLQLKEIISEEIHHHSLGGEVEWELTLQAEQCKSNLLL